MSDLLQIDALRLAFGDAEVVHGVDLCVPAGPYGLGVIGESGSGKTTIARAIVRLHPVLAGRITFGGLDVSTMSRDRLSAYRRSVQMVFQDGDGALDPRMSVLSAIGEPFAIHRTAKRNVRRERVTGLMDEVGLPSSVLTKYPHQLSGGQRQRVVIARALALEPKLLILDEPTSALDVTVQERVLQLIEGLRDKRSLAYILISHNLAVVDRLCERSVVLYQGSVVEAGDTRQLLNAPQHPYTRALRAAVPEMGVVRAPLARIVSGSKGPNVSGCSYVTRCPIATEICHTDVPQLRAVAGREVACHHAEEG